MDKSGVGEYFDSYGLPPIHEDINHYLNEMCPLGWGYNSIILRCLPCLTCDQYCVLYLKLRALGYSYCDVIALFSKDLSKNEELIKKLVHI